LPTAKFQVPLSDASLLAVWVLTTASLLLLEANQRFLSGQPFRVTARLDAALVSATARLFSPEFLALAQGMQTPLAVSLSPSLDSTLDQRASMQFMPMLLAQSAMAAQLLHLAITGL